jgi:hypothetical protein
MTQFLRPESNITQTNWNGGFADIDEVTPDDSDFSYGNNNSNNARLEVLLSSVPQPDSGTVTVRWRHAKVNNGTLNGAGGNPTQTCSILQGSTQLTTLQVTPGGSWTEANFTLNTSAVSDWSNLRLRWVQSGSGGGSNARGTAVSWAEVEAPGIPATRYVFIT